VPATICAVAGVAPGEAGLASGLVNTSRLVGGALGLAVLAALATAHTNGALHHRAGGPQAAGAGGPNAAQGGLHAVHAALTGGFRLAFAISAGFALAGGLVALFGLPRIPARAPGRAQPAAAEA
jgi:hypothetical protein